MMARKIAKAFKMVRTATNEEYFDVRLALAGTELPLDVHQRLARTEVREWKSSRHTQSDPL